LNINAYALRAIESHGRRNLLNVKNFSRLPRIEWRIASLLWDSLKFIKSENTLADTTYIRR